MRLQYAFLIAIGLLLLGGCATLGERTCSDGTCIRVIDPPEARTCILKEVGDESGRAWKEAGFVTTYRGRNVLLVCYGELSAE